MHPLAPVRVFSNLHVTLSVGDGEVEYQVLFFQKLVMSRERYWIIKSEPKLWESGWRLTNKTTSSICQGQTQGKDKIRRTSLRCDIQVFNDRLFQVTEREKCRPKPNAQLSDTFLGYPPPKVPKTKTPITWSTMINLTLILRISDFPPLTIENPLSGVPRVFLDTPHRLTEARTNLTVH